MDNPPARKKLKPDEKPPQTCDAEMLRQTAIPRFEELARYLYPYGHKEGCRWCVGNVNGDPGRTFSINLRSTVFGDFADGQKMQSGAINLWMAARAVDFKNACQQLADWLGIMPGSIAPPVTTAERARPKKQPPHRLSRMELLRMYRANLVLCQQPELVFEVLGERPEWTRQAIRGTALEGDLGFEHNCQWFDIDGPAVLFAYKHGIKARWLLDGKRVVKWIAGASAGQCWRQSLLRRDHQRVYITEGETDTLTAISIGLEFDDVPSLVIGLASASQIPEVAAFRDKEVIIVADPGPAGTLSSQRLFAVFRKVTRKITLFQLEAEVMA